MILKRILIFILFLFVAVSCGGPKKPKNLISKDKMVNILIDASLLASANASNKRILEEKGIYTNANTYVLNKYNIDSLQFAESNTYYTERIKDYEEIYQRVKDSLELLKGKFKELEEKERVEREQRSKDSLDAVIKKRDSITLFKGKDSLEIIRIKDSLSKIILPKEVDEELEINLIDPISEN
ncbi:DUF4296 domain-containing protein [Seonamhaeicola sp. MEBiC1930]|uniref:DUF4296 domain-containing protein n=1 Tax=Seonamhaeicola sp. MEBiC01930 TaxID=2976768 RepID=UPI0032544E9C